MAQDTDKFRGTGRTTRMLQQALDSAVTSPRQIAYVVGWDRHHVHTLMKQFMMLPEVGRVRLIECNWTNPLVKCEYFEVRFVTIERYHWNTNRIDGVPLGTVVLLDHLTHERRAEELEREARRRRGDPPAGDGQGLP